MFVWSTRNERVKRWPQAFCYVVNIDVSYFPICVRKITNNDTLCYWFDSGGLAPLIGLERGLLMLTGIYRVEMFTPPLASKGIRSFYAFQCLFSVWMVYFSVHNGMNFSLFFASINISAEYVVSVRF